MNPSPSIPDDIFLEILTLLPLKSLLTFKQVSKSWLHLIKDQILKKSLPLNIFILYYTCNQRFNYLCIDDVDVNVVDIDLALSFMPNLEDLTLVDCSNGLILCRRHDYYRSSHYVSNPATKTWVVLPEPDSYSLLEPGYPCALHFDQRVSPYFTVLSVDRFSRWSLYSSKAEKWVRSGKFEFAFDTRNVAFWEEAMYVITEDGQTLRYRLDDGILEEIALPTGLRMSETYIGTLGGEMCLAGVDGGRRLSVWGLGGCKKDQWVVRHWRNTSENVGFLAFHPVLKVVYVLCDGMVYAYDLDKMTREVVIERDGVGKGSGFVFSPCFFDVF